MNPLKPFFSVVMPVYNGEKFVGKSIDSLLNQDFESWELVVVDDASADATPQILREYADRDSRIRVIRNEKNLNCGPSANRGIESARGPWIARMDADDLYLPHYLSVLNAFIQSRPATDDYFVTAWVSIIDDEGKRLLESPLPDGRKIMRMMPIENFIYHSATAYPRALWRKAGGYPQKQIESDDLGLWKRFLKAGAELHVIPRVLVEYRIHDSNLTLGALDGSGRQRALKAFWKNAEWKISLFIRHGRRSEARRIMRELGESKKTFSLKHAFYFLLTLIPAPLAQFFMWEVRPRLRMVFRRFSGGAAA